MKTVRITNVAVPNLGTCELWAQGRSGSKSPYMLYLKLGARRITPYEVLVRGYEISLTSKLNIMFQWLYSDISVASLIMGPNPLLARISKSDTAWVGAVLPIPWEPYED